MNKTFQPIRWAILMAILITPALSVCQVYNMQESINKLQRIGQALQRYRATKTVKPVSQRVTYKDCGLPQSPIQLCGKQNMAWSLPGDRSDFKVTRPSFAYKNAAIHFAQYYWESPELEQTLGSMQGFYSSRGEQLPILVDLNMNSDEEMLNPHAILQAIILRLNGEVDVVTFDRSVLHDLLRK